MQTRSNMRTENRKHRRHLSSRSLAIGVTALVVFAVAPEPSADAAVAYVRSTVGAPWGQSANEEAMDLVFGAGGWEDLRYETVDPSVLFSDAYTFLYLEGSDNNAAELAAFLSANGAALSTWVNAGGGLFLNAAPNEGVNINFGFGVTLVYPDDSVNPGAAANPSHPIWNGPFLPTSPDSFTGSSFAHATVTGAGLVALIVDANGGNPHLAERGPIGEGRAIFGGLTTSNFWTPAAESLNLRANIIAYLSASVDQDGDGISNTHDNCVDDPNPGQEDADGDDQGDACDACPDDPLNDADGDLVCEGVDNCPGVENASQADGDGDELGDACDPCPADPDNDIDADTICGDVDNCPDVVNVNQADEDGDGVGNICDPCLGDPGNDPDADGACALVDNCPDDANADQADGDSDGVGDACDVCPGDADDDIDGDGVCGDEDNCPDVANDGQEDADGDGIGDACDEDVDPSTGDEPDPTESMGSDTTPGTDSAASMTGGESTDTDGDTASGSGDSGGCGCRGRSDAPPLWVVAFGLLGFARRRRSR